MPNIEKLKMKKNIEGLVDALSAKKLETRIQAVNALEELGEISSLIEALNNDNNRVRKSTILALRNNYNRNVEIALINLLSDEDSSEVWEVAFDTLTENIKKSNVAEKQEIWYKVAEDLLKKKEIPLVSTFFEKILEIYQDKEFLVVMGSYLIENDIFELALNYFNRIIDIDPNEPRAWATKGHILLKLNSYQDAINCCNKALEHDPTHMGARNTLRILYYVNKDYDALISLAKETLETMPEDIKSLLMLSEALSISGKLIEAESEAFKALGYLNNKEYIQPEDLGMIHQQIGMINVMRGYKDKAFSSFQIALDALPKDEWLQQLNDSYKILEILGLALECSPVERRNQLISLTEKRNDTIKGINVSKEELVLFQMWIDDSPINYMDNWTSSTWTSSFVQRAMAKYWPPSLFARASEVLSSSSFENFCRDIKEIIKS
jgi:tetratricopeptide (TPR) repeat protein